MCVGVQRPGSGRPGLWFTIANRKAIAALPAAEVLGIDILFNLLSVMWVRILSIYTLMACCSSHPWSCCDSSRSPHIGQ